MIPQPLKSMTPLSATLSTHQLTTARNFLHVLADPKEPEIDIVAVHGLNPWGSQQHAEATWTAGTKLWLRDFLPARLPEARILLFDYNANVAFQSSTAGIQEQSQSLLNRLEHTRKDNPKRPLIFICHSLGGIVVKRALICAKQSEVYRSIVDHTFGIVFFGTPHKGGNHAKVGDLLARIIRRISGRPKNSFMSALKKDSWFASTISSDFRQFLEILQFQSYYETRPMRYFGIIVEQKAAVLGLPDSRERSIALDADHSNICKFKSETDPVYLLVEENIAMMANDAVKRFGQGSSIQNGASTSLEAACLTLSREIVQQCYDHDFNLEGEDDDPQEGCAGRGGHCADGMCLNDDKLAGRRAKTHNESAKGRSTRNSNWLTPRMFLRKRSAQDSAS